MNDDADGDGSTWDGLFWDAKLAVELIGKRVLVGITDLAADGSAVVRRELHGHAIRADLRGGITLRLDGPRAGEEVVLPPDTRAFRPAPPGDHRLQQTGEVVKGADYLMDWSLVERDRSRDHWCPPSGPAEEAVRTA